MVMSQPWRPGFARLPVKGLAFSVPNVPLVTRSPLSPLICDAKKLFAGLFGPEIVPAAQGLGGSEPHLVVIPVGVALHGADRELALEGAGLGRAEATHHRRWVARELRADVQREVAHRQGEVPVDDGQRPARTVEEFLGAPHRPRHAPDRVDAVASRPDHRRDVLRAGVEACVARGAARTGCPGSDVALERRIGADVEGAVRGDERDGTVALRLADELIPVGVAPGPGQLGVQHRALRRQAQGGGRRVLREGQRRPVRIVAHVLGRVGGAEGADRIVAAGLVLVRLLAQAEGVADEGEGPGGGGGESVAVPRRGARHRLCVSGRRAQQKGDDHAPRGAPADRVEGLGGAGQRSFTPP